MQDVVIKYETLYKMTQLSENLRKEAIKRSLVLSLSQTIKTVVVQIRKQLPNENILKINKNLYAKRVRRGKDLVDMSMPIPTLFARIVFSNIEESLSSFPYRLYPIRSINGRKSKIVVANILGKYVENRKGFLVTPKKGKAIRNTKLSLKRTGGRLEYSKLKSDVSVSDILEKKEHIYNKLKDIAMSVYYKRLSNNLNYNIIKAFKEV